MHLAYIRTRAIKKPKAFDAKKWMTLRYLKRAVDNQSDRVKNLGLTKEEVIAQVMKRLES